MEANKINHEASKPMRRRNIYIAGMILLGFVLLTLVLGLASCKPPEFQSTRSWREKAEKWEQIATENARQRDSAMKLLSDCAKGARPE